METTEVFRINKDGSITVFEASLDQYQEAIKLLIDWKSGEIERLREALQKICDFDAYDADRPNIAEYMQDVARSALQQNGSE